MRGGINANKFYDNLILSGTKIQNKEKIVLCMFYDNLILSGTKIQSACYVWSH